MTRGLTIRSRQARRLVGGAPTCDSVSSPKLPALSALLVHLIPEPQSLPSNAVSKSLYTAHTCHFKVLNRHTLPIMV